MIHSKSAWTDKRIQPRGDGETPYEGVIVHHSAVRWVDQGDTKDALQAIQRYHMDVRGWRDIGYNFMIDPYGDLWVGRGFDTGAHTTGKNRTHLGVCVLGDYEKDKPTTAALEALEDFSKYMNLLAGFELPVSVHGDHGATACCGHYLKMAVRTMFGDA